VSIYAWRRRKTNGAIPFALAALGQASWTVGYIFELASPSLEVKIFWDNAQLVGMFAAAMGFFVFALEYAGHGPSHPKLIWGLLAIVPVVSLLLVFTNRFHGWARPSAQLIPGEPFSALVYDFSALDWVMFTYAYGLGLSAEFILIGIYLRPQRFYHAQTGTILVGILIPMIGSIFTLLGVVPAAHRDISPLTFAIGNLIVAWGLFRYRLFDIVPMAHHAVIEGMSDAIVVLDTQNRVVDLNPAAQEAIGREASKVIGQPVSEVYSDYPDLIEQYRDTEKASAEIAVGTEEDRRHFELRVSALHDRRGQLTGRLVVVRDITERKRAEEELRERTRQLEAANERLDVANKRLQALGRAKDEFVSNVSHELRTPISNLKLHTYLLAARPEKRDTYISTLEREVERLEALIEGLLMLSRLDQDRVEMNLVPVDLNVLAEEYVEDRAELAESKGLTLELDPQEPPAVRADRNLIGQILSIMLTNAFNYTPSGGHVVVSTYAQQRDNRQWVGFSVSDTGLGILPEEKPQLFTRFFRGNVGRQSGVPGTGLGLAIAREIIERHRGRIEVESEGVPGKGTVFRVWLPAE
jgi:PAS domain S-box-containing protein